MIDIHCHILPGIDDGSPDLSISLEMARMAVADGIVTIVCTPHFTPGIYNNTGSIVAAAVSDFALELERAGIPLNLVAGNDAHATPDLLAGLRSGRVLCLGGSRYFLLEPPQNVLPPRFESFVFDLVSAGFVPILTHPERMSWIDARYDIIIRMAKSGVLMQITAASLTGQFGRRPRYWSERMLDEGLVHFVASDAHNIEGRPPVLSRARELIGQRVGEDAACDMVATNPLRVLDDASPTLMYTQQ